MLERHGMGCFLEMEAVWHSQCLSLATRHDFVLIHLNSTQVGWLKEITVNKTKKRSKSMIKNNKKNTKNNNSSITVLSVMLQILRHGRSLSR